MEATSVILPQKLGLKLREKAEEMGYLPEELGVELLKKGDLVQASEKFWGATALTIKMSAAKKGLKLEEHGSLWAFVSTLSRMSSDEEIVRFFGEVNVLHRNFYVVQPKNL